MILDLHSKRVGLLAGLILALLSSASPVMAAVDPMIEGARQCTQYFPIEEKKNSIPAHLLAAIATTESGVYHKGLGMSVPWPWTINVEGKGYHFDSKAEAIARVQNLQSQGYRSIDVGCMQVNLKHHAGAFANLDEAFDPKTNVGYAAKFLHDNYATLGDWIKATAAYHSRTDALGQRYLVDIERSWNRIVGKVAEARASKANDAQDVATAETAVAASTPRVVAEKKPRVIDTTSHAMQPLQHARVIKVNDTARSRSSEVMVVRATPSHASQDTMVATAAYAPTAPIAPVILPPEAPQVQGNSIRRVSLDNPTASAVPVAKATGPQFVFAN